MANILLSYEFGAGLGHLNRLAAVAEHLKEDHTLTFAVPSPQTQAGSVEEKLGRRVPVRAGVRWAALNLAVADKVPTYSLADALRLFGFGEVARLRAAVLFWQGVIQDTKPDLIISDFAPSLHIAAAGRIPIVVVGNGYTLPPSGRSLPPIRPWSESVPAQSAAIEADILRVANAVGSELGHGTESHLADLFHGTKSFVCSLSEFDPYKAYRLTPNVTPFNIPDIPVGPEVSLRKGPDVFVYLSTQHPHLHAVLSAVNKVPGRVEVYVGGADPKRIAGAVKRHIGIHTAPANFKAVLPNSKVLLHHGGLGTAFAGLGAGTAQLVLPLRLEHLITAKGVLDLGGRRRSSAE